MARSPRMHRSTTQDPAHAHHGHNGVPQRSTGRCDSTRSIKPPLLSLAPRLGSLRRAAVPRAGPPAAADPARQGSIVERYNLRTPCLTSWSYSASPYCRRRRTSLAAASPRRSMSLHAPSASPCTSPPASFLPLSASSSCRKRLRHCALGSDPGVRSRRRRLDRAGPYRRLCASSIRGNEQQGGALAIFGGVSIDLFSDGVMIGTGTVLNPALGLLLALGQMPAGVPEGFAAVATLRNAGIGQKRRLLVAAGRDPDPAGGFTRLPRPS